MALTIAPAIQATGSALTTSLVMVSIMILNGAVMIIIAFLPL